MLQASVAMGAKYGAEYAMCSLGVCAVNKAAANLVKDHVQPLAQQVADEAEPRTKAATKEYVRDPASEIAKRAVPTAKKVTDGQLRPGAQQVCVLPTYRRLHVSFLKCTARNNLALRYRHDLCLKRPIFRRLDYAIACHTLSLSGCRWQILLMRLQRV